jgi:TM2 domain-containing membrane protein YozV
MNPTTESGAPIAGYCRDCGKALTQDQLRMVRGVIYCADHAPEKPAAPAAPAAPGPAPYSPPPSTDVGTSPGAAFALGFIPGVGAIYNGQYAKGLVHVIIFGFLISILSSGDVGGFEPLFGLMLTMFFFYMAFEAYHTAKRRLAGETVDEFSSLFPRRGGVGVAVAPILLILLGVVFLLNNLGIFHLYQLMKYWPVLLIILGVALLIDRMRPADSQPQTGLNQSNEEVGHEVQ